MPTENEKKYVLKLDCESQISETALKHYYIGQGYLVASKGLSLRVRSQVRNKLPVQKYGPARYTMTFKSSVSGGRVVEIEKKINERDFTDLWPQTLNKLVKERHVIKAQGTWEIDFFKDHNNETYFAMAEFEMPEGQLAPKVLPGFITMNLLHEVSLTDCRFSSKLLGDVRYAKNLLQLISKESCNV